MKAWLAGDDLGGYIVVWADTPGKARIYGAQETGNRFLNVRVRRAPKLDGEPKGAWEVTQEEFVIAGGSLEEP